MVRPGHGVRLEPELGHPERVEHVLGVDAELHRAVLGQHQLVGLDLLAGVVEGPGELLAGHVHDQRVGLLGLEVVEHDPAVDRERGDHQERDRHPDDLEPRVAVDRRAVAHVAGLGAEADDAVDRHRHDEHEDRHRADQQDVVDGVDLVRRAGRGGRGTSRSAGRSRCRPARRRSPARSSSRPGASRPRMRGSSSGGPAGLPAAGSLSLIGARVYWSRRPGGRVRRRARSSALAVPARRERPTAGGRGGGGRPWRTAPPGGSPTARATAATGSVSWRSSSAACAMRTRWSSLRKLVPCSANTRWSWRREVAIEWATAASDRFSSAKSRRIAASASSNRVRRLCWVDCRTTGVYVRNGQSDVESCCSAGLSRSSLAPEGGCMQVRDGMSSVVLTVNPGHSLREAASSMAERRVGAAVVMDPEQPGPGHPHRARHPAGDRRGPGPRPRAGGRPPLVRPDVRRAGLVARGGGRGDGARRLPPPGRRGRRRDDGHPVDARHRALLGLRRRDERAAVGPRRGRWRR